MVIVGGAGYCISSKSVLDIPSRAKSAVSFHQNYDTGLNVSKYLPVSVSCVITCCVRLLGDPSGASLLTCLGQRIVLTFRFGLGKP